MTVTPHDDLHTALRRLTELNVDEIPVVAPDDSTRLIGLLHRRELVSAYSRQIDSLLARAGQRACVRAEHGDSEAIGGARPGAVRDRYRGAGAGGLPSGGVPGPLARFKTRLASIVSSPEKTAMRGTSGATSSVLTNAGRA